MDNGFFITLIYIFIIIIFLSSLFRKKNRGTNGKSQSDGTMPPEGSKNPEIGRLNYYNSENSGKNQEMMKGIQRFFEEKDKSGGRQEIPDGKPPERKETKIETYNREKQEKAVMQVPDEYSKWPGSEMESAVQTAIKDVSIVESELRKIDSNLEKEAGNLEKLLNPRQEENVLVSAVREKIKNMQTVKEYIVLNEILGKPKALKR